jgi:hypothetical protein
MIDSAGAPATAALRSEHQMIRDRPEPSIVAGGQLLGLGDQPLYLVDLELVISAPLRQHGSAPAASRASGS